MSFYQTVKRAVPLEWKLAFHKRKSLPRQLALRVSNRLSRQPPLPPSNLIFLVTGSESPQWFLDSGRSASEAIRDLGDTRNRTVGAGVRPAGNAINPQPLAQLGPIPRQR